MADPPRLVDDYSLYIGGQWVEPRGGRYDDISPATEETIAQAPDADLDDVDAAIGAARAAFDEGPVGQGHTRRARPLSRISWATRCSSTPTTSSLCPRSNGADHHQRAADPGRRSRVHGAARGRTGRTVDRRTDRRIRGGRNHPASPRAARRGLGRSRRGTSRTAST